MFNFRRLKNIFKKNRVISIVNLKTGEYIVNELGSHRLIQKNNFISNYQNSWDYKKWHLTKDF